jgi:hypothetical protein
VARLDGTLCVIGKDCWRIFFKLTQGEPLLGLLYLTLVLPRLLTHHCSKPYLRNPSATIRAYPFIPFFILDEYSITSIKMHNPDSPSRDLGIGKTDEVKSGEKADPPLGIPPRLVMATIQDDDERMLARIGYRQVCYHLLSPFCFFTTPA